MNTKQLNSIEKKARRVAENSFEITSFENERGKRTGYAIVVDGHLYGTPESFYEAYPELAPRKQKRVYGPYRVKNIGVDGNVYEVVEMVNNTDSRTWQELRPRKTYTNRQPAYGKCLRLNKHWQEDHIMEDELLDYWQNATN